MNKLGIFIKDDKHQFLMFMDGVFNFQAATLVLT